MKHRRFLLWLLGLKHGQLHNSVTYNIISTTLSKDNYQLCMHQTPALQTKPSAASIVLGIQQDKTLQVWMNTFILFPPSYYCCLAQSILPPGHLQTGASGLADHSRSHDLMLQLDPHVCRHKLRLSLACPNPKQTYLTAISFPTNTFPLPTGELQWLMT